MPKVVITNEFLKRVLPPTATSKEQYFDTELNGFMLEVKNSGSKTYYYRYREDGKQTMQRIGDAKELSLQEAKKRYFEIKADKDKEPTTQISKEEQINPITFKEFYEGYYLPYIKINLSLNP